MISLFPTKADQVKQLKKEAKTVGLDAKAFNESQVRPILDLIYQKYRNRIVLSERYPKLVAYKDCSYRKKSGLFKIWLLRNYPLFSKRVITNKKLNSIYQLIFRPYSLEQIIQYLPVFILRRLEDFVEKRNQFHLGFIRHLLEGNNVRTFKDNPIRLSKKMAHIIHNLTEVCQPEFSYYTSLVYSSGGNKTLVETMPRFWANLERDYDKIKMIALFFSKYPEVSKEEIITLLGYINHMIMENRDYQLKGRNLSSLRRASDAYYEEMRQMRLEQSRRYDGTRPEKWKGANYDGWKDEDGHVIVQLTESEALDKESATMSHCVRTYAHKCNANNCSIWSLRYIDADGESTSLVTIEVLTRSHEIIQAKAEYNQAPSQKYMNIIKAWAKQERLSIAQYV